MTGKVPSSRSRKEKSRNSRPYDRANQSIFGKVASTVKGLFTPSWLFNVSSWVSESPEEQDVQVSPEDTAEADLTENEDEPEVQPTRPRLSTGRLKRPRLESPDITSNTDIPFWLRPSTSHDHLTQEAEKTECDPVRKEAPIIVNGDDHSENSDGSASTSGCSSLVSSHDKPHRSSGLKLSDSALEQLRTELKNKPSFHRQRKEAATLTSDMLESTSHNVSCGSGTLWSCRKQSTIKSPQIPSLLNCSRPSFNVSSFGGPSKGDSPSNKVSSPYYEGNTTFGGASAYRKRARLSMAHTPYEMNPNKSVHEMRVKEAASTKDCMSSAARKILQTLETMSTPVKDAKKIPNVCRSPLDIPLSITPPSQRMKSFLSASRNTSSLTPKGPPVINLNQVSKLTVLKNHRSRMSTSMMELPLREQPMTSLPEQTSARLQDTSDTTHKASSGGGGGGKMKSKLRESFHAPPVSKPTEESIPEYELPNVSLPISSSLPVFKLHSDKPMRSSGPFSDGCTTKKPTAFEHTTATKPTTASSNEPAFTFASPIEYVPPKSSFQPPVTTVQSSFTFSSPLIVTPAASKSTKDEEKCKEIYTNRSVDDILKKFSKKTDREKEKKSAASTPTSKTSSPAVSGNGFKVHIQPGSWECITCLIRNQANSSKCVACETPKPDSDSTSASKNTSGFGDKFLPPKNTWECSSCMVRNDSSKDKCAACETERSPSTKATTSAKPESDLKKEPPKLFQNTAGTWECDACLVRNSLDKNKCVACETLRPTKGKTGTNASAPFKFGASSESSGFKFSSLVTASVTATTSSTFKFGCTDASKPATSLASSLSSGASAVSPAAIFGNSAVKSSESSESNAKPQMQAPFKFGIPAAPTVSSESLNQGNSQPASSESKSMSEIPVAPSVTTTAAPVAGIAFAEPSPISKPAATENTEFNPVFLKKPSTGTSDTSRNFTFPAAIFGTSVASTAKFGTNIFAKVNPETSAPETSRPLNFAVTSTTPLFNVASTVTSQSDAFHSKALSQKTDKPAESKTEASVQPVVSTFTSGTPVFSFGAVTSTPATSVVTTSSNLIFGALGGPATQTEQKLLKGNGAAAKTTASPLAQAARSASNVAPFSFPTVGSFPAMPAAGAMAGSKPAPPQDQAPRTQASLAPFSFGITPTTASVFTFGGSTTAAVSSSGFTCTTTAASNSSQVTKTVDAVQTSQTFQITKAKPNIFTFGASEKSAAETKQPGLVFKEGKEDPKPIFPQSSQPLQFGAFKSESVNNPVTSAPVMFKFGSSAPSSSSGFVFGSTTKSDTTTMPAAQFTFGSGLPKAPSFGGFQPSQQPVTSSMPTFSFGSNMSVATTASAFNPTSSTAFAFTAKSNATPSINPQPVAPSAPTPVAFGSSTMQTNMPVFGGTAPAPSFGGTAASPAFGTPAFGSVPAPKQESSGGFNFNPHQRTTNVFQFGSSADKPQPAPSQQGSGFAFGMNAQVDANPTFAPNFNMVSPPSFNFGGAAASTPANQPFQFAASADVSSTPASAAPRKIRKAIRRGIRKPD